MNLDRMLDKCRAGQWKPEDLDWSVPPKELSRDDEIAVVQYFTNMAGIERLAKALFAEQRRRTDNPVLKKIFSTFVADEERHAVVAEQLARHYDVHHYRDYALNQDLVKFRPHFLDAIRYVPNEIATIYITTGELLLDVALLRSLDDYVDDDMSRQAMHLINRDESRHIAVDYYMVEYYSSDEYIASLKRQRFDLKVAVKGAWAMANMMYHAKPFVRGVFIEPMSVVDPDGVRMREAFKRIQLLGKKPDVARRPFARFIAGIQAAYNTRAGRLIFGRLLSRIAGVPGEVLENLYTADEERWARDASFDSLVEDALQAKYLH